VGAAGTKGARRISTNDHQQKFVIIKRRIGKHFNSDALPRDAHKNGTAPDRSYSDSKSNACLEFIISCGL
jgi:hypothetical protein